MIIVYVWVYICVYDGCILTCADLVGSLVNLLVQESGFVQVIIVQRLKTGDNSKSKAFMNQACGYTSINVVIYIMRRVQRTVETSSGQSKTIL